MDEEEKHSLSEVYYPDDLQTLDLDAETQTGNAFYNQKPSVT